MKALKIPSVPHLVHIETTYACNKRCKFCYNPKRGLPFRKETIDKIVASVYGSWVPHVYLIGGEPSLLGVPQLNEYINLLSARSSVTVVTNGIITLEGLSDKLACIGVPIHGDEKTHNIHSETPGRYADTVASIKYYVAAGFDVRCIPVLTAWNFDQIYNIARLAKELGMESVFVDRFEDGGIGSANAEQLKPTIEQFKIALGQMIRARDELNIPMGFGTAIPYCLDERLVQENMSANCGVGITFAAIDPDGSVRICNQSQVIYGNVLTQPIEEIWKSDKIRDFRDLSWVTEPCKSCPVLHDCLCGCKVDCSCSDKYCVDYAVRNRAEPLHKVETLPKRGCVKEVFPREYRRIKMDPLAKLNEFHQEKYLITRYQTIEVSGLSLAVVRRALYLGIFSEADLVSDFSAKADAVEVRKFCSKLVSVGAAHMIGEKL
ncbi:MAG: radical SAM protein [Candidatus Staskawiczbacteria bacterium]|nr:radical SAM protein [Candidatus Staskawiczbacteria bacterium]